MSDSFVEYVNIDYVKPHPNADKLDIAIIKGTTCVIGKDSFVRGDKAVFFPPDILIPESVADKLGVKKYLKHAIIDGVRQQCRVAACRLRTQPSYGFVVSEEAALAARCDYQELPCWSPAIWSQVSVGENLSSWFDARKYEPPLRPMAEDAECDDVNFHKYTSIEHYWKHHEAIAPGTPVRITEKIHGTNSRVGVVRKPDGEMEFMAGSHRVRRKPPKPDQVSLYWSPLTDQMQFMLGYLSAGRDSVVVFGEIYGNGIQDMDYGCQRGYRVFDISVNGRYLNWDEVEDVCCLARIETVPLLYRGPFSPELLDQFTYGPTTLATAGEIVSAFKDREGCVITPLTEQFYAPTGGRLILKSVSADYLDRKGAKDDE